MTRHEWEPVEQADVDPYAGSDFGTDFSYWRCRGCGMHAITTVGEPPSNEKLSDNGLATTCEEFRVAEVMES